MQMCNLGKKGKNIFILKAQDYCNTFYQLTSLLTQPFSLQISDATDTIAGLPHPWLQTGHCQSVFCKLASHSHNRRKSFLVLICLEPSLHFVPFLVTFQIQTTSLWQQSSLDAYPRHHFPFPPCGQSSTFFVSVSIIPPLFDYIFVDLSQWFSNFLVSGSFDTFF